MIKKIIPVPSSKIIHKLHWIMWMFNPLSENAFAYWVENFGDIVKIDMGNQDVILLNHPLFIEPVLRSFSRREALENIFVSKGGQFQWVCQRSSLVNLLETASQCNHVNEKSLQWVEDLWPPRLVAWERATQKIFKDKLNNFCTILLKEMFPPVLDSDRQSKGNSFVVPEIDSAAREVGSVIQCALLLIIKHIQKDSRLSLLSPSSCFEFSFAALLETLRLYPLVNVSAKFLRQQLQVNDYLLPKGSVVMISPQIIHHDPRFYEYAEVFDLNKWMDSLNLQSITGVPFYPFGLLRVQEPIVTHFLNAITKFIVSCLTQYSFHELGELLSPKDEPPKHRV